MSSRSKVRLSVIVPVYNEEKTVQKILKQLLSQKVVDEVVVVDDASTDKTSSILAKIFHKKLTVLQHAQNSGKGKAIRTALSKVKGNYVLIQDADLEYDPNEIPKLLEPIRSGRATVIFGSRFLGPHTNMFYWHFLGNKFLNFMMNLLYDTILSDMETCYKLIPTKLFRDLDLQSNDFRIEPEISCKLLRRKIKILEVPISYIGRSYDEGKKITWVDGMKAIGTIVSLRFS